MIATNPLTLEREIMSNYCINLKKKVKKRETYFYCCKKGILEKSFFCSSCLDKEYKKTPKNTLKKSSSTNKVSKATSIPKEVKMKVWERDAGVCIFCGVPITWNLANSHFIKRSHLGLGIEENIFCACLECHHKFDDTTCRKFMLPIARSHLKSKYEYWNEDMLVYKKY